MAVAPAVLWRVVQRPLVVTAVMRLYNEQESSEMWELRPRAFQSVPASMPATFYIKQYHPLMCWHIVYLTPLWLEKTHCVRGFDIWAGYSIPPPGLPKLMPSTSQLDGQTENRMKRVFVCKGVYVFTHAGLCGFAHTYCTFKLYECVWGSLRV